MSIATILTIIGLVITFVFSLLAFCRNKSQDNEDKGENKGVIMSDIGYIKAGVDDLKRENRETRTTLGDYNERITRCEESCKQAHHRIDEIKGGKQHEKLD